MYIQTNMDHDKVLTVMQRQNYITARLMEQQSTLSLLQGIYLLLMETFRSIAFVHGADAKAANSIDCIYVLEQCNKEQPRQLVKSC